MKYFNRRLKKVKPLPKPRTVNKNPDHIPTKKVYHTIPHQKVELVFLMFFRTTLLPEEDIIDNTDQFIAESLGLHTKAVSDLIAEYLKNKYNR